jgi:predicted MFS family arabinose efflux permease
VGGPNTAGLILGAFGAGGALGVVVHRLARTRLSPVREGCAAMGALAFLIATMSWIGDVKFMVAVMVAAGCGAVVAMTALSVAVQRNCTPALLGRVMAIWVLAFAGVRPLAALALGNLAAALSLPFALRTTSLFLVAAACGLLFVVVRAERRSSSVLVTA